MSSSPIVRGVDGQLTREWHWRWTLETMSRATCMCVLCDWSNLLLYVSRPWSDVRSCDHVAFGASRTAVWLVFNSATKHRYRFSRGLRASKGVLVVDSCTDTHLHLVRTSVPCSPGFSSAYFAIAQGHGTRSLLARSGLLG